MCETKRFPLRVLLTVTTGRFLTQRRGPRDNGIGDLYSILDWMTQDTLFTHQLPRAGRECKSWLYRWFPELGTAEASLDKLAAWIASAPTRPEEGIRMWLAELQMIDPRIRNEYDVGRIPPDDHERKDPYDELVTERGTDEGVMIVTSPDLLLEDR